ncbi:MAG: hypothetical protein JWO89_3031, partial [Verrucomicrobiaceae bacterium]|nr:hypothetical protein [Verrucomicrobiaceae bacterium]
MNRTRTPLLALFMALSACEGPILPVPPPIPPLPPLPGMSQQAPAYERSDDRYLPDEYRSGYDIGGRDASYGYPPDGHRAYDRFG